MRWIQFDDTASEFIINVEDLIDNHTLSYRFDNMIIASGHFTAQVIPHIDGLVSFSGPVLHSHHFRDPEIYKGQRILIIGGGDSAEDVCWHCFKNGALSVIVSVDNRSTHHISPNSNIHIKPLLRHLQGNVAYFSDASFMKVWFDYQNNQLCQSSTSLLKIILVNIVTVSTTVFYLCINIIILLQLIIFLHRLMQ